MKGKVKLTVKGLAGAALVAVIMGMVTGGGFVSLDPTDEHTVWMTKGKYNLLIKKLKEDFEAGIVSSMNLLFSADPEMQIYKAILDKEAHKGTFKNLQKTDDESLLEIMIKAL